MSDPRKPIFEAVKLARGRRPFVGVEIAILDGALDQLDVPREGDELPVPVIAHPSDPPWITEARSLIGLTEIPGPQHNSKIVKWWHDLGAPWFNTDEAPWCGDFVGHCMQVAGQPFPKDFPRALAWASWGKDSPPRLGAVAVFKRTGGGHVGFMVGESATDLYILGGNQKNQVNIMPIKKDRLYRTRWPAGLPLSEIKLPRMSGGVVSTNEA